MKSHFEVKKCENKISTFILNYLMCINFTVIFLEKLYKKLQVNVVYEVNCNDCEASYVGESKRGMGVRIPEHELDSKKAHKERPLFKHMIDTERTFDFDGSQI